MGLREDDYLRGFSTFKWRVERISVATGHLYCTICVNTPLSWTNILLHVLQFTHHKADPDFYISTVSTQLDGGVWVNEEITVVQKIWRNWTLNIFSRQSWYWPQVVTLSHPAWEHISNIHIQHKNCKTDPQSTEWIWYTQWSNPCFVG